MTILRTKKVLIVEDNIFVGEAVASMMADIGALPVGPALTEAEALDLIDPEMLPDVAILDLGLDRSSINVAAKLHDLRVPFIFATGMPDDVPARFSHVPTCAKPYTVADLIDALNRAYAPSGHIEDRAKENVQRSEGYAPKMMLLAPQIQRFEAIESGQ